MPRAPATLLESAIANCRPQPAIPAVLVLLFTLMFAGASGGAPSGADSATAGTWIVTAGIVASCGLAVAAGFCSYFPPLAWIAVAFLSRGLLFAVPGRPVVTVALAAGTAAAAAMLLVQFWRVRTGKFVPTVSDSVETE